MSPEISSVSPCCWATLPPSFSVTPGRKMCSICVGGRGRAWSGVSPPELGQTARALRPHAQCHTHGVYVALGVSPQQLHVCGLQGVVHTGVCGCCGGRSWVLWRRRAPTNHGCLHLVDPLDPEGSTSALRHQRMQGVSAAVSAGALGGGGSLSRHVVDCVPGAGRTCSARAPHNHHTSRLCSSRQVASTPEAATISCRTRVRSGHST
jgi:hypothetical protein